MISKGAKVLIILAQDTKADPAGAPEGQGRGHPGHRVRPPDRGSRRPVHHVRQRRSSARPRPTRSSSKVPKGNYVLIKGDPGDPNASTFLPQGWDEAGLKDKVASGDIVLLNGPDGTFTDAWKTEKAQTNMEAIIDKAVADGTKIDAILAENDSTALGVVGALTAKSYGFPPLSGQDGDPANLNNVALGKQYVDVWKNANELGKAAGAAALELCNGWRSAEPDAAGRPHRPGGRPGCRAHGAAVHDPGRDDGQVVHPAADPADRGEPPAGDRRRADHQGGRCARASTPATGAAPPASSGHPTARPSHTPAPPGPPGAQVVSQPGPGGPS